METMKKTIERRINKFLVIVFSSFCFFVVWILFFISCFFIINYTLIGFLLQYFYWCFLLLFVLSITAIFLVSKCRSNVWPICDDHSVIFYSFVSCSYFFFYLFNVYLFFYLCTLYFFRFFFFFDLYSVLKACCFRCYYVYNLFVIYTIHDIKNSVIYNNTAIKRTADKATENKYSCCSMNRI